jgi:hypothetical protein
MLVHPQVPNPFAPGTPASFAGDARTARLLGDPLGLDGGLDDAIAPALNGIPVIGSPVLGPSPGGSSPLAVGGLFGAGSPLENILQALLGIVGQLMSLLGLQQGGGPTSGNGNEQYFTTATGASQGDPHLSFDGTTADGSVIGGRWDAMTSQPDLLDSDSFAGGWQLATQTGTPGTGGVTYNTSATITTQNGQTAVTLDAAGDASVTQNGTTTAVGDGQSLDLGNGESVSRTQDGTLTVTQSDGLGDQIVTTLKDDGPGVDVTVSARGVDLGGSLVAGAPHPRYIPLPEPVVAPVR